MSDTDTTPTRPDEAKEVLRSLSEVLCHPEFLAALARFVSGERRGEEDDSAEHLNSSR